MKKLSEFFKLIFQFAMAVLLAIIVIICVILGLIFSIFETLFKYGRSVMMACLIGVVKDYRKEEKIKTIMQTTMKSKRTH